MLAAALSLILVSSPAASVGDDARERARRAHDDARALGDNSDAEERLYQRATALDPRLAGAWYDLGLLYLLRGDSSGALRAHRQYAALRPDAHEAHFLVGVDHQMRGDLRDAVAAYRRALELRPTHFDSLHNLAQVVARGGDPGAALPWYRKALAAAPRGRGLRARCDLAHLYLGQGRFDEAIELFHTVLAVRGTAGGASPPTRLRARVHNSLGRAYEAQRRLADAAGAYTAAAALDPTLGEARDNLSRVRAR